MATSILLFMGGIGIAELGIGLVVAFIPAFFIGRAVLKAALRKGEGSVGKFSVILGLLITPAILVILFLLSGIIMYNMYSESTADLESVRQKALNDTTLMEHDNYIHAMAHPTAKTKLTEEFYWSSSEEAGPFGNDDGADAMSGFVDWRQEHGEESPVVYLNELIDQWGFDRFDWSMTSPSDVDELLNTSTYIVNQDNAIIAIGFGQFVLEGRMDDDVRELTRQAIERELNEQLIQQFRADYQERRRTILNTMLETLKSI